MKNNQYKKNKGFLLGSNPFNSELTKMTNYTTKKKNKERKKKDCKEKRNLKREKQRYGQKNQ
jgi:hypothetical protein